jgi:hypothetical protein
VPHLGKSAKKNINHKQANNKKTQPNELEVNTGHEPQANYLISIYTRYLISIPELVCTLYSIYIIYHLPETRAPSDPSDLYDLGPEDRDHRPQRPQ